MRANLDRPRRWSGLLVISWVISGWVSYAAAADRALTDVDIRDTVEQQLLFDESVPWNEIDVSSAEGIVTLTGTVSHILAKERAAKIARTVKGVRSVVNRIAVEPRSAPSDEDLRRAIREALAADPATENYEITEISPDNGRVSLRGTVDSYRERDLVHQVVESVRGVREIVDPGAIEISTPSQRSDREIEQEIEATLEWDLFVDDGLIDVEVTDGVATLTGTAGSAAERWRAVTNAWVPGVVNVDDADLAVERWARDDDLRRHKYVERSDEEIRAAVEDALQRDPRLVDFDVSVSVDGGITTLRGVVDNLKARRAAEQDARNTVGVVRVSNRLKVRVAPGITDETIRSDVLQALIRDSMVESLTIDVEVLAGKVTLRGEVDSFFEKFHAGEVVSRVVGVVSIDNELEVDDDTPRTIYDPYVDPEMFPYGHGEYYYDGPSTTSLRTDRDIESDVEDELWWSPFVDSDDIDVSVLDGVVTLTGTVDNWAEARTAIENAYEGGARRVKNDLTLSGSSSS